MWSSIVFFLPHMVFVAGKGGSNRENRGVEEQTFLKIHFETSSVDNTSTSLSLLLSDGTSNLTVNVGYYNEKFHGFNKPIILRDINDMKSFTFGQYASVKISTEEYLASPCVKVSWKPTAQSWPMMDCIPLQVKGLTSGEEEILWYGGAEMFESTLASNTSYHGMKILDQPFYSSDIYASHSKLGSVLEAMWINSAGWRVESLSSPLWVSFKDETIAAPLPSLCLRSDWSTYTRSSYPYSQPSSSTGLGLGPNYKICKNTNLYEAWKSNDQAGVLGGRVQGKTGPGKRNTNDIKNILSSPNMTMVEEPIWSTWAEFKKGRFLFVTFCYNISYHNILYHNIPTTTTHPQIQHT